MTNFQDLVAKVKNLVALAPVLGAISRPERTACQMVRRITNEILGVVNGEMYEEKRLILG